jgi:hypothetical protein
MSRDAAFVGVAEGPMGAVPWFGNDRERAAPIVGSVPLGTALPLAIVTGVLMSTQMLFQPFVWRNWPLDEILLGWFDAVRDALVVACMIALAVVWVTAATVRRVAVRALLLGGAIVGGAGAGHLLLALVGGDWPATPSALAAPVARWSLMAASVAGIHYTWQRAREANAAVADAELQRVQAEHQAAQVHLQALRGQIEPHFLFNTLATVRRLQHTEPAEGAQLLAHFLDYLRLTLPARSTGRGRLGDEIDLVHAYLGVVAVRMSGRLRIEWDVADALGELEFPPLVVATLVENAIRHGLAPLPGPGTLHIGARRAADVLEVVVADTGVGFSGQGGCGIGLANIRARLATAYGAAASLRLEGNTPRGVRAVVRLPCRAAGGAA